MTDPSLAAGMALEAADDEAGLHLTTRVGVHVNVPTRVRMNVASF
ncbi:hypothetical protein [Streptomyces sp. ISL-96]|nr:hypothetical protein [Streptomyces sp. ISL-96]